MRALLKNCWLRTKTRAIGAIQKQASLKTICVLSIKFDPCLGLRVLINMSYYENVPRWIREIPRRLKTKEMCEEAAWIEPRSLAFVPDCFKIDGLCIKAVRINPYALHCVPDNLKTQKICNKAMRENPAAFFLVPDRVMMLLMSTHGTCTMYLITLKHKKCGTMWSRGTHILYGLSLIGLLLRNN